MTTPPFLQLSTVFACVILETNELFEAVLFTLTLLDVLLSLETLANGLSLLSPWLPLVVVLEDAGVRSVAVGAGVVVLDAAAVD